MGAPRGFGVRAAAKRRLAFVAAVGAAAVALAVAVPLALASGTYNLNGKWSLQVLTCKHTTFAFPGNTIVTKWNAKTGKFNWKLKAGAASIHGTATESGSTITVTSSDVPSLDGHTGTVTQTGSTLKATFPAPCPNGAVGYGTFTKKAKPKHHKVKPKHHKVKHHKGKHHKHHKK